MLPTVLSSWQNLAQFMAEFSPINAEALLLVMAWLHTDSSSSKVNLS
jgi:hypothetical protein